MDKRRTDTYHHIPLYRLPIDDYREEVRLLVPFLGGDPEYGAWEAWAEMLLWDFNPLPFGGTWLQPELQVVGRYFRNLGLVADRRISRVPSAPFKDAVTVTGGEKGAVQIRIHSRYVPIQQFPGPLQTHLVSHYETQWGTSKEPPSVGEIVSQLGAYTRKAPTAESALERLWNSRGEELEALPVEEQKKAQERAKAAARQQRSRITRRLST